MKYLKIILVILVLMLPSCKSKTDSTPTLAPNAIYTSAVQTVAVQLTENAIKNPSATPTQTYTSLQPIATQPASTIPVSTTAPQVTTTVTLPVTEDKVEFIDTTPDDGTVITAGESFKVSWAVKNIGKTTWTTGYQVRFFSGDRMGADLANSYSFSKQVLPGETIAVTADFIAPSKAGNYKSIWVLTNQDGVNFYPVYIEIKVGVPSATPAMTQTQEATSTETPTVTNTP